MAWLLLFGILLTLLLLFLYAARSTFRDGMRAEYLNHFPILRALLYTFGLALMIAGMDWVTDKPEPASIPTLLGIAAICFLIGCALWLAGFFFGRRRAPKREGILRR